jgi:hypothetical protein
MGLRNKTKELLEKKTSFINIISKTLEEIYAIYERSDMATISDFDNMSIVKCDTYFRDFLEEIVCSENAFLRNIEAYYHPVGFIKMILFRKSAHEKIGQLRLHFWGSDRSKAIVQEFLDGWEPCHNHRWSCNSKVIRGGLDIREYSDLLPKYRFDSYQEAEEFRKNELKEPNQFGTFPVYYVPKRKQKYDYNIKFSWKYALLGRMTTKRVIGGEVYSFSDKDVHQVKSAPLTTTLLLIDPETKHESSEIFKNKKNKFDVGLELKMLTEDEIRNEILVLLKDLAENKHSEINKRSRK